MSLSEGRMHQLMAYADGELSGTERIEVEVLLSENEDARRFVAELGTLGGLVRTGWENRPDAKRVAAFDITDAVMKAVVAADATAPKAAPAVTSLDAARQKRAQRMKLGGVAVAVLAAAAAVALVVRTPAETPIAKAPSVVTPVPGEEGPGVEVEAVESPGSSVSVFYLPGANEVSTSVVVWVDETGEK